MWKNINLQECLDHINAKSGPQGTGPPESRPTITISRMCGSGGRTVASNLADYLKPHAPYGRHWTIFDQNLIKKVLEDHWLPANLAEFLPERSNSLLGNLLRKLRTHHPSTSEIVEHTVETIWHLAAGGQVILVGRGANVITASLPNVFHVRLVGSLERRIERLEEVYDFDRESALDFLKSQDSAKKQYLKEYFGADIDDPGLYHLVVNTDRVSYAQAAKLIGDAVVHRFNLAPATNAPS